MRLTTYTDYGLRVLTYLALRPQGATVREMSDTYGVSRYHLMKVVQQLVQDGYLSATRGRGGGLKLARPPENIVVGDVVRKMEADMHIVECFGRGSGCIIGPACKLKGALGEALNAFLGVLDGYTLADLCQPSAALTKILFEAAE